MIEREKLSNLYSIAGLSASEIANILQTSEGTVNWWMKKYEIKKRNRSDANYLKYNKNGDPFHISDIDSIEKGIIYGLGVGLFWGEGNKVNRTSLRVGNTDSDLIKTYVKFLREFCKVDESRIRFGLQLFNDSDPEDAIAYWLKQLNVPRSQFMDKISSIPVQGIGTYKKKNKYGVVTVYVNNIKLVDWMHSQIEKFRN
jgi:hypothetical protein